MGTSLRRVVLPASRQISKVARRSSPSKDRVHRRLVHPFRKVSSKVSSNSKVNS